MERQEWKMGQNLSYDIVDHSIHSTQLDSLLHTHTHEKVYVENMRLITTFSGSHSSQWMYLAGLRVSGRYNWKYHSLLNN
jgi:hypothetical protein